MAKKPKTSGNGRSARSAARLAAVQATYQNAINPDLTVKQLVKQFTDYRLGKTIDDVLMAAADGSFFADLVTGIEAEKVTIDGLIAKALKEGWPEDRLETTVRAILRAGCFELTARPDVPTAVVINEYLDIAHAFFAGKEVGFINGVLDRIAKEVRS